MGSDRAGGGSMRGSTSREHRWGQRDVRGRGCSHRLTQAQQEHREGVRGCSLCHDALPLVRDRVVLGKLLQQGQVLLQAAREAGRPGRAGHQAGHQAEQEI